MALVALLEHACSSLQNTFDNICHEWRPLNVQTPNMLAATSINYDYSQRTVELNEGHIFNLKVILTEI